MHPNKEKAIKDIMDVFTSETTILRIMLEEIVDNIEADAINIPDEMYKEIKKALKHK
ncbi:MAG: hypothetical protein WC401_07230 [Bacteroidales bacterium]